MTVPSTTRRAGPFTGNGVTTSFPFAFKVFGASDIALTIANASGVAQSAVLNQDYLVTLNPDQTVSPGGSVQYAASGVATALPTGYTLAITGSRALAQTVTLPTGGAYQAAVVEAALDSLEMQIQQIDEQNNRALILSPLADTAVDTVLPAPEANALLGWNDDASALQNVDPATMAAIVAFGTANADTFTGDGVTTAFTLSASPGALANLDVSVGGVTQTPVADYTWAGGTTLTFTSPPPTGVGVLVRYMRALPQGAADSAAVTYAGRSVGARLDEMRSVMDDIGSGVPATDGLTSSQTALAAAVAAAYAGGYALYWPDYDFVSTASIPNFHSVRHWGPGRIKRGSDTFYLEPTNSQTNILYVAAAGGDDANDGLSASQPVADYGVHFTRLSNWGPVLSGNWRIQVAAGTYNISASKTVPQHLMARNAVVLQGPEVTTPTVPTAIVDGGGTSVIGVIAIGRLPLNVRNIKFQNCRPGVGGGVYTADGITLYTYNVHVDNCTDGIYSIRNGVVRVQGGIISNCAQGYVCSVGSMGVIGYNATNLATGTQLIGNNIGVSLGEASSSHIDYCTISSSAFQGVLVYDNSRANLVGTDLRLNAVAIETRTGGIYDDNGIVWNTGTANANTVNRRIRGQTDILPAQLRPIQRAQFSRASSLTLTGSTALTQLVDNLAVIPAEYFGEEDRLLKVDFYYIKTGTLGTANLKITLGGVVVVDAQLQNGTTAQTGRMTAWIVSTGMTAQRHWYDLSNNVAGSAHRIGAFVASAVDMSTAKGVGIAAQLTNAADTIQVVGINVEITG